MLTRDTEDAAILLNVLQGVDPREKRTATVVDVDPMHNLRLGVEGLCLGRLPDEEREGIDADVLAAFDRSVNSLAHLGARIVDVTLPGRFTDLGGVIRRILPAEAYAALSMLLMTARWSSMKPHLAGCVSARRSLRKTISAR